MSLSRLDERFMREALAEAHAAAAECEVPIGAVVVYEGEIIARAHNRRELDEDPSAHAEFSAMVAAARALGRWRLKGCTVYVTLEPCVMCAGLMVNARVTRCVYGAADPKAGALGSLYQLNADRRLNHAFEVTAGVLSNECAGVLKAFFAELRGEGRANDAHVSKRDEALRSRNGSILTQCRGRDAADATAPRAEGAHAAAGDVGCLAADGATGLAADDVRAAAHPGSASCATDGAHAAALLGPSPRVLLAIDSFKGSATSAQAEAWVIEGILHACPNARVTAMPIGDGGEGTGEALAASGGMARRAAQALDAFGRVISAEYLLFDAAGDVPLAAIDGSAANSEAVRSAEESDASSTVHAEGGRGLERSVGTYHEAFIEMAVVAGLGSSDRTPQAAIAATTYGVGELVLDAIACGAQTIYLGLGGSATNDGGAGFLQALGARLLDVDGRDIPTGLAGLEKVASIDLAPAAQALGPARLIALSDVTNPLVGSRGALRVFGPQKGLAQDPDALDAYDRWMVRYGALLDAACRAVAAPRFRSLAGVPGAGAAGGLGAAVLALGGALTPGIDAVLDRAGFDEALRDCDVVVTGEGMMDGQTAGGKAPLGVARRARAAGVPVVAVVGGRADDLDAVCEQGIDLVLPIVRRPMDLSHALDPSQARANLRAAGEAVIRAYLL
ncbi:MAG TPA: tRNA adenosine(34) deaminase TadA [Enorma massiliensis]|nr:tRNA adenosine(34) deaminase TadA [Enorma massiliensis]HJG61589.1 tRNA adenosine(34) deaminase TadA [Enorma massiliensis]